MTELQCKPYCHGIRLIRRQIPGSVRNIDRDDRQTPQESKRNKRPRWSLEQRLPVASKNGILILGYSSRVSSAFPSLSSPDWERIPNCVGIR